MEIEENEMSKRGGMLLCENNARSNVTPHDASGVW